MSKFTPGPWITMNGLNLFGLGGRLVANCGGHYQNFDIEKSEAENEANTRLIAAAPDLSGIAERTATMADLAANTLTSLIDGEICDHGEAARELAEGLADLAMDAREVSRKATQEG